MITIAVYGTPAPQGSKRAYISARGRAAVVESGSARQKSWRQAVVDAALGHGTPMLAGPVAVDITFTLARPKSHYRTGKNAHLIRDSAPSWPARAPDIDKLTRNTLDGLTAAGTYADDGQVVKLTAVKQWADGRPPGAHITVTPLTEGTPA
jgi:Holliday junction resolvase RusA-like endonuclease